MKQLSFTGRLGDYLLEYGVREHRVLRALRKETAPLPMAGMQIGAHQGALMALLVRLLGARRTFEVGTFTGYSALAVALALPPEGRVVACDVSEEYTSIARRYWKRAGVSHKIDLRLAPGLDTLKQLSRERGERFDFAFIDADKENYDEYYERALSLLRVGGLVAIDNVLWSGRVADPRVRDRDTRAIRALNAKIARDRRVSLAMVPIADGLTLAMKM
jgi:predicted O-methyltransferase YrrM